jgi:membrane fusion protein (multidrug efflux system)
MRPAIVFVISLVSLLLTSCTDRSPSTNPSTSPQKKVHLVETFAVVRQTSSVERERTGTLRAQQEIEIYNQEGGRITALPYYAGDRVKKGDLVARLDDRLLRSQLARTQALRRKAEKDLQRIQGLADRRLAAQSELTRVETELAVANADEQMLETRLDYTRLRAPIAGVISERFSEPGNIAERYTHLLTISDQRSLITDVTVSELLINKLRLGDAAAVTIDALSAPGSPVLQGTITRIHPNLNPITRTGTIEIVLNPPPGARPGQLVRVRLQTQEAERLLIPFTALRRSSQGEYVFILDAEQRARIRPVVTGLPIDDRIEVLDGLTQGEQVVVRGFTNLHAGTEVTVVASPVLPASDTPLSASPASSALSAQGGSPQSVRP